MIQFGLSPAEWADTEIDADYEPPRAHAPPLFVHANLLKHSGYSKTSAPVTIKFPNANTGHPQTTTEGARSTTSKRPIPT